MPKVALLNIKGEKVKDINLADQIWGIEPNDAVLYDAIVLARASLRQGTHKVKNRSEVRGGGKKPWRQKGTGRARQGSIRAPQWAGGGIVFGPQPRSYDKKMNKKERRLALKSALSYKVINKEIIVLDELIIDEPKTKLMKDIINNLKIKQSTLIVTNEMSDNLMLSVRNIKNIKVIMPTEINVYDLTNYDCLLVTETAIKTIEEVLL
ncbi:MAG: 50S ribosomal protein L4 [Bacilli bacterium]|nr:50S ribosomal protein L4 [Bacilli bacterium]